MKKVKEQVPEKIRNLVKGIFTCSGNAYTVGDNIIYDREFNPPEDLVRLLKGGFGLPESPRLWYLEYRGKLVAIGFVDCRLLVGD